MGDGTTGAACVLYGSRGARRGRRRRGFTLVELLVVIGIIALLIGLLVPVLGRARRQAAQVACLANIRSQLQAVYVYATQHNGALVCGSADPLLYAEDPGPATPGAPTCTGNSTDSSRGRRRGRSWRTSGTTPAACASGRW